MFRTSSVHLQERFVEAVFADLVCGNTRTTYQSLRIQLVQNAPDDGPVRSETCRANICDEQTYSLKSLCVSCWTAYIKKKPY